MLFVEIHTQALTQPDALPSQTQGRDWFEILCVDLGGGQAKHHFIV